MPHDCKGRKIDVGDTIKALPINRRGARVVGTVIAMHADTQTCTGQVRWLGPGEIDQDYFDAAGAEIVLKVDGSEPPEG